MPHDSGRYPVRTPRSYDEEKGYVAVVAQGPRLDDVAQPLHPADWNDAQQIAASATRRNLAAAAGTGACDASFNGFAPGAVTANVPVFTAVVSDPNEPLNQSPFYLVAGIKARTDADAGAFDWDATDADVVSRIHRKCTGYVVNTVTDLTAQYAENALVGRTISLLKQDNTWTTGLTISANTKTTISFSGGPSATSFVAGGAYRINPTTPGTARTDAVWLDVWVEEIAAAAVSGDPFNDQSLNINFAGTVLEPTRRMQVRQALFIEQSVTGTPLQYYVDPAGAAQQIEDTSTPVYKYTDASGIQHYVTKIAEYYRYPGSYAGHSGADVGIEYVADKRVPAGVAAHTQSRGFYNVAASTGVVTGYSPARTSNTVITIGAGSHVMSGIRYSNSGISTDRPTDGTSTSWANTTYYVLVDASNRVQVRTAAPSGAEVPICKFTVAGGLLPVFTESSNFSDLRRFVINLATSFMQDADGYFRNNVQLRAGASTPRKLKFRSATGGEPAEVGYYPSTGTLVVAADENAGATECRVQSVTGGGETASYKASGGVSTVRGDAGIAFLGSGQVADGKGVLRWEFDEVRCNKLVAPGITLGSAAGTTPVTKTIYVPAIEGQTQTPGAFDSTFNNSDLDFGFVGDYWQVFAENGPFNSLFKITGSGYGRLSSAMTHAFLVVPLRVPVGWTVGTITARLKGEAYSGVSTTVKMRIAYRDDFSNKDQDGFLDADDKTVTVNASTDFSISYTSNAVNLHPRLYACFFLQTSNIPVSPSGAAKLIIQGIEVGVTYKGIGDYALNNDLSQVIEGLGA